MPSSRAEVPRHGKEVLADRHLHRGSRIVIFGHAVICNLMFDEYHLIRIPMKADPGFRTHYTSIDCLGKTVGAILNFKRINPRTLHVHKECVRGQRDIASLGGREDQWFEVRGHLAVNHRLVKAKICNQIRLSVRVVTMREWTQSI